jgi:hypothetical protein
MQPRSHGLTFGIDHGSAKSVKIFGRDEYIGRSIVIASRLQGAARRRPESYAAYASQWTFERYFAAITDDPTNMRESVQLEHWPEPAPCYLVDVRVDPNWEPPPSRR